MLIRIANNHPKLKIMIKDTRQLVKNVLADENLTAREINIIFVPDEHLKALHKDYLQDDSYTDVMTFNLSDNHLIEAEIYIAPDRAKIHAKEFNVSLDFEIARLIIHGLLHLKGFDDADESQRAIMRNKEDHYLRMYFKSLNLLKLVDL